MQYAFHRLARSAPQYAWWKALVVAVLAFVFYIFMSVGYGVAVIAIGFIFTQSMDGFLEIVNTGTIDLSQPFGFALGVGSIVLLLPAIIFARLIMGPRPLGLLSSVTGRLRWRWLLRCTVPALAVFGLMFAFALFVLDPLTGGSTPVVTVGASTWLLVILALIITPLQATAEEYVFRGYLMQTVGGWLKHPAWAILLPVPLFAIGHQYDIWGLLDVSIFAIFAGWLTWRTGGLEAAIVAHIINNTALFIFGAFGLADLNATSGTPYGLLSTLAVMVGYSAIVVWQAKRVGLETTRFVAPVEPVEFATPAMAATTDPEGPPPSVGASTLGA